MNHRLHNSTKRRSVLGTKRTSRRRLQFENLELRQLMAVNVAIVFDQFGNTGGYTSTRDQLANDTFADFNASLVQASTLNTLSAFSTYDVIVIGGDGNDSALANTSFASALSSWVNAGGGVVMTGFGTFGTTATSSFRSVLDATIPIQFSAGWGFSGASNFSPISQSGSFTPATHAITNNVASFSIGNGSAPTEWSQSTTISSVLDSGATLLGTLNGRLTGAAAPKGNGRSVWLGPAYTANSNGWGSFTGSLRSGNADRLLEQAVLWAGSAPASILDVVDVSPDPRNSSVNTVDVVFSRPINAATFSGSDITLTRNGGANLIDGGVSVSLLSGNTYRISNLASLTGSSGNYSISVNGAGITDANGNVVSGSVTDSWVVDVTPPTVATSSFAASGALSSSATSMTVTFDEAISGAANAANYQLQRAGVDGLLGTVDDTIVTVASASLSGNTATLNFAALAEDVYRLTVKQTITDLTGNMLDGDGNGTAGGDWRRDFVVGALTTALTSPNGFVFDPAFGGSGAGQLVQGPTNAFDGTNRLQVSGTAFSASPPPLVNVSESFANVPQTQIASSFATLSGLSTLITTNGANTVRLSSSFNLYVAPSSNWGNVELRFVVDGVPLPVTAAVTTPQLSSGNPQVIPVVVEDYVTLASGPHTITIQARQLNDPAAGGAPSSFPIFVDDGPTSSIRAIEFYSVGSIAESFANIPQSQIASSFTTLSGLSTSITTNGANPVRLSSSFNLYVAAPSSNWANVEVRFVVDGVPSPVAATVLTPQLSSGNPQVIPVVVEDYVTLASGLHTIAIQTRQITDPAAGGAPSGFPIFVDDGPTSSIRAIEFYSVGSVAESFANVSQSQIASSFATLSGLSTAITTNGANPVRLSSSFNLLVFPSSNWANVEVRFVVDGVPLPVAAAVTTPQLSSGNPQVIPVVVEDYVTLAPGPHTITIQARQFNDPAAGGAPSSFQIIIDDGATASIRAIEFASQPVLSDAGRTVSTNNQLMSSLNIYREVTIPSTGLGDFARTIDAFVNESVTDVTVPVRVAGNLGSDAATTVFATSDGDLNVEPTDLWFGTDDADGSGTPAIIHLLRGPYGLQPTSVNVIEDNVEWTYNLTVPAGATRRLAHFTVLGTTRAEAIAAANTLVTTNGFGGEAAAFLTAGELSSLANFQFNTVPTDLSIGQSSVAENLPTGSTVGTLTTVDANVGDQFVYSLVGGQGDTDNSSFTIEAGLLKTNAVFNYEAKNSYAIRVRTTDLGGLSFEKELTITVENALERTAPVQIGDGTAQRSVVNRLVVSFDQAIEFDAGAFQVFQRVKDSNNALVLVPVTTNVTLAATAGGMTATLTFSGALTRAGTNALVDGNYQLTINGGLIRILNTTKTFDADGDGNGGGLYELGTQSTDNFFALLGDANGNGEVDAQDLLGAKLALRKTIGQAGYNSAYDINGNGVVDAQDILNIQLNLRKKRVFF